MLSNLSKVYKQYTLQEQYCHTRVKGLCNYMTQSASWKSNSSSARQDILHLLRNLKDHYRVHKSLLLLSTLR
jgi:hypothetical protein